MLTSVTLSNFKSVEKADIDLDDVVVTFVGENNHGKSTCSVNPLGLVLGNGNWPDGWIRHGCRESSVILNGFNYKTGEKFTITRTKSLDTGQTTTVKVGSKKAVTYTGTRGLADKISQATGVARVKVEELATPILINVLKHNDGYMFVGRQPDVIQRRIVTALGLTDVEKARVTLKADSKTDSSNVAQISEEIDRTQNTLVLLDQQLALCNEYEIVRGDLIKNQQADKEIQELLSLPVISFEDPVPNIEVLQLLKEADSLLCNNWTLEFDNLAREIDILVEKHQNLEIELQTAFLVLQAEAEITSLERELTHLEKVIPEEEVCEKCGKPL